MWVIEEIQPTIFFERKRLKSQTCPNCGAPLYDELCDYCGDPRIERNKQDAFIDFLLQINKKCDEVPDSLSWKIVLIWLGIPALVSAAAYVFTSSTLAWVIWIAAIIFSLAISTIISGTMRNNYLKEKYRYILSPILMKYLRTQKISQDEAYRIAKKVLPKGAPLLQHLTVHPDLDKI